MGKLFGVGGSWIFHLENRAGAELWWGWSEHRKLPSGKASDCIPLLASVLKAGYTNYPLDDSFKIKGRTIVSLASS